MDLFRRLLISEKDRNDVTRLMYYDLKRFLDE